MQALDDITGLLGAWADGDSAARDRVFGQVYAELRRLAAAVLRQRSGHATLQPTALLNDTLLKLIEGAAPRAQSREHFIGIVARAMRQVLVDRARRQLAEKRGAGVRPLALLELDLAAAATDNPAQLIALDDALQLLQRADPRAAEVVELRVFVGLTIDETAAALGISPSAVNREWAHASAWLKEHVYGTG